MADSKLSCFFLGLGVGTAVGLLFAPKPGGELMGDLRERASEGRDFFGNGAVNCVIRRRRFSRGDAAA